MTDHIARGCCPRSHRLRGPAIRIRGVSKTFGRGSRHTVALKEVDLDVAEREFLCIVGASGCGKSTLLNLIAGLDKPSTGTIDTGGRKVAFMFQEATLFPWLTAGQNVDLALKLRGVPKAERARPRSRSSSSSSTSVAASTSARTSCPAACGSARSWRACSRRRRRSS